MTRVFWKAAVVVALICPAWARADDSKTEPTKPSATSGDSAKPDAKKELKGRLPPYYSKVVDETQRGAIYKIDEEYAPKLKDLHSQLDALTAERDKKVRAVLTADQQKKVDELAAVAKNNKKRGGSEKTDPKSTKPDVAKPDPAKPDASKPDATVPVKPATTPLTK